MKTGFGIVCTLICILAFTGCSSIFTYQHYAKAQVEIAKEQARADIARAEADKTYYAHIPVTKVKTADGTLIEIPQNGDPAQLVRAARDGGNITGKNAMEKPEDSAIEKGIANALPNAVMGYFMMGTASKGFDTVGKSGNTSISSSASGIGTSTGVNTGFGSNTQAISIPTVTTYPIISP